MPQTLPSHSLELYLLMVGATMVAGLHGYLQAKMYREGLPPVLDALLSMVSFAVLLGAFSLGGWAGGMFGHPYAGRVVAVLIAFIAIRLLRALLGIEQAKHHRKKNEL